MWMTHDDSVIEIELVTLSSNVVSSSSPSGQLFEQFICETFLWQTADALLAWAET